MEQQDSTTLPEAPAAAHTVFGERLGGAVAYAELLASTGVDHGLIGPREVPRLWERHLLNCAVVGDLIAPDARVADVGSGAGLPGLVLAILRPDLHVTLIEPLQRRVTWLDAAVEELGLINVDVRRARAQNATDLAVDVVCSRAVSRLSQLTEWSLPLLRDGGTMLALKGASAAEELRDAEQVLRRAGVVSTDVVQCGVGVVDPPTTVVRVVAGRRQAPSTSNARKSRGAKSKG
ncbi:16S rRNA (guanine(527)-N(7))-methyltransferase RsmG [Allobranchiibius sp. CTAmp26]|uniref:16S rRNA (guanine(527)-N(7))-methyltransferase RsmG n=1 Tax=Allobranchiibius sp. CTAmp26 TaxID=2815214 RepID=UPI001AA1D0F1|nr:16S rRNA (guanine(527)-N(7))-methyltransferase RsmG [Allobranchiibius sp. CTAmp26]MBO1756260.1 16S rRNA (guanine(527)-N(7))-methyltransferase RsmG [Allobranchiibius sp. CTAmp26]